MWRRWRRALLSCATKSCIGGFFISEEDADYIAQAATEGGYEVEIGETRLNMAFERTENDARRTEASYKLFAGAFGDTPTSDVLFRKGNVVMAWDNAPTDKERSYIEDCLLEGGETQTPTTTTTETVHAPASSANVSVPFVEGKSEAVAVTDLQAAQERDTDMAVLRGGRSRLGLPAESSSAASTLVVLPTPTSAAACGLDLPAPQYSIILR